MKKNLLFLAIMAVSVALVSSCNKQTTTQEANEVQTPEVDINQMNESEEEEMDSQSLGSYWSTNIEDEEYAVAMNFAQQYQVLNPDSWKSSALIGETYFKQDNYKDAQLWLKKAMDGNPEYADFDDDDGIWIINYENIVNDLALAYQRLQDYDACITLCQNALQSQPDYYSLVDVMACAYALRNQEGDIQTARTLALDLLNRNIDSETTSQCYFRLAWLYEREGKPQAAITLYEKSISLCPYTDEAYYNLSELYAGSDPFYSIELKKKAASMGNELACKELDSKGIDYDY